MDYRLEPPTPRCLTCRYPLTDDDMDPASLWAPDFCRACAVERGMEDHDGDLR